MNAFMLTRRRGYHWQWKVLFIDHHQHARRHHGRINA